MELKSVRDTAPIHKAHILTYLKSSGEHLGLILNFNTAYKGRHRQDDSRIPPLRTSESTVVKKGTAKRPEG